MKHIYITLFLLTGLATGSYAQSGFHIGVEGNYNATFIIYQEAYGQSEFDYAPTFGMGGGVVAGYNIGNHFGIQVEGLYSEQGQNYKKPVAGEPTGYRHTDLYYTHIPLLFKYSSGSQYACRFYVMAGPQYSMLDKATLTAENDPDSYTIDAKNRFVKNNWDVVFELGSEFNIYKGLYASAGLRLNYGLNDINAPDYRMPNRDGIYNASQNAWGGVNIGVHYLFPTKSK